MNMLLRRYHTDSADSEIKPVDSSEKAASEPKKDEEQAATEIKRRSGRRKLEDIEE